MNSLKDTHNLIFRPLREGSISAAEAIAAAKAYLCPYGFGFNCGRCIGCELADEGKHPDIFLCGDPEHFPVKDGNLIENNGAFSYVKGFDGGKILIKEDEEKPKSFTVWVYNE